MEGLLTNELVNKLEDSIECKNKEIERLRKVWHELQEKVIQKDKEIERLEKELESALVESCKYFDCSYREALKEE